MSTVDLGLFSMNGFTLSLDDFNPMSVNGPDKVAQRFIYYLLTPAGTIPGQLSGGTSFLDSIRTFRSEYDLFVAFAAAEPNVAANVRLCELDTDPPSHRYGFSRLSRIELSGDEVTMTVLVVAADGSTPNDPVVFSVIV